MLNERRKGNSLSARKRGVFHPRGKKVSILERGGEKKSCTEFCGRKERGKEKAIASLVGRWGEEEEGALC